MHQFTPFSLNIKGRLINCNRPQIMGIINVTPDSFYSSSRTEQRDEIKVRVEEMLASGVDMIDLGGYSSRPGAPVVSPSEELSRLERGMEAVRAAAPNIPVSIDTKNHVIDYTRCVTCMNCLENCSVNAISYVHPKKSSQCHGSEKGTVDETRRKALTQCY